ncbi:THAP domain-containing protein 2-like [Cylas formicarius]|uniref:THAP domain-containing protein 2-like n=1 Tax=Cylas formicarius TaxID=197179 RepID=UPI0029585EA4|nr:THAP domain-containing protein 2-like [Cylas formicarius]
MTQRCEVCNKLGGLDSNVSFHGFPRNVERRKVWCALLGFAENKVLRQKAAICSDHFKTSDFDFRCDGVKFLKRDVFPQIFDAEVFRSEKSRSSSLSYSPPQSPPRKRTPKKLPSSSGTYMVHEIDALEEIAQRECVNLSDSNDAITEEISHNRICVQPDRLQFMKRVKVPDCGDGPFYMKTVRKRIRNRTLLVQRRTVKDMKRSNIGWGVRIQMFPSLLRSLNHNSKIRKILKATTRKESDFRLV